MRRRVHRLLAASAVVIAALVGAPGAADAQVAPPPLPELPPVPSQLDPVLHLLAPLASPTCGSAALLALTASSLVPASPASPFVGTLLAPVYIACGNVPVPPSSNELVCAIDDQVLAAASTATLAVIGAGPPVSTRAVGPVVEIAFGLQSLGPPAVADLGVAATFSSALACRLSHPPAAAETPAPSPAAQVGDRTEVSDEFSLPELGLDGSPGPGNLSGDGDLVPGVPGAVPAGAVAAAHPFAYPFVFVVPLVLLAVGGYLARSLTDDIRFPAS